MRKRNWRSKWIFAAPNKKSQIVDQREIVEGDATSWPPRKCRTAKADEVSLVDVVRKIQNGNKARRRTTDTETKRGLIV